MIDLRIRMVMCWLSADGEFSPEGEEETISSNMNFFGSYLSHAIIVCKKRNNI
jgi:hypothetical protein